MRNIRGVGGIIVSESCWLIEFEDGYKMIISEELYKMEVERNWGGRLIKCEAHWFDVSKCRSKNRGVAYFGVRV